VLPLALAPRAEGATSETWTLSCASLTPYVATRWDVTADATTSSVPELSKLMELPTT